MRKITAKSPHWLRWSIAYNGGEYAEVMLDGRPVEVINCWDYADNVPLDWAPRNKRQAVSMLHEWLIENHEWLGDYGA